MSEVKIQRGEFAPLSNDILRSRGFTFGGTSDFLGEKGLARLDSDDYLLIARGGTDARALDLYLDLMTDETVTAALQKQISEIVSREWKVIPGGPEERDQELAQWCQQKLMSLGENADQEHNGQAILNKQPGGMNVVCAALLEATIIGFRTAEVIWKQDEENFIYPCSILPKDSRRFIMYYDKEGRVYPRLRTLKSTYQGEPMPPRKFIFHSFWTYVTDNPMGMGLGRMLYYPVTWKRETLTSWANLIDNYVTPTKVGKVTDQATDDQKHQFFDAIRSMAQNVSTVLPQGYDFEVIAPQLNGSDAVLQKYVDYMDRAIYQVILGESTTGQQGDGSQARDRVSNSIRVMKAKSMSDQLNFTLNNTLLKWMAFFKDPQAAVPRFVRDFEDLKASVNTDLIDAIATITSQIPDYRPDLNWLKDKTGIPRLEEDEEQQDSTAAPPSIEDILAQQSSLLEGDPIPEEAPLPEES